MSGLQGKTIIVTRAPHQADALAQLLTEQGATPALYPCVDIAPPDDSAPLDTAPYAARAGRFNWLALTSANTVWAVARRLAALDLAPTIFSAMRLAAIGPATAAAIREALGLRADIIPDEFSGAALARVIAPPAEARILLPRSSLAESAPLKALIDMGAAVTCVVAYKTVLGSGGVDLPLLLLRDAVDAITVTSSSAATNVVRRVRGERGDLASLRRIPIVCIGPSTAETARTQGLQVVAVPDEHTLNGLVASLEAYFAHEAVAPQQEGER
jgi:uroporphyrinogen-III synthase